MPNLAVWPATRPHPPQQRGLAEGEIPAPARPQVGGNEGQRGHRVAGQPRPQHLVEQDSRQSCSASQSPGSTGGVGLCRGRRQAREWSMVLSLRLFA